MNLKKGSQVNQIRGSCWRYSGSRRRLASLRTSKINIWLKLKIHLSSVIMLGSILPFAIINQRTKHLQHKWKMVTKWMTTTKDGLSHSCRLVNNRHISSSKKLCRRLNRKTILWKDTWTIGTQWLIINRNKLKTRKIGLMTCRLWWSKYYCKIDSSNQTRQVAAKIFINLTIPIIQARIFLVGTFKTSLRIWMKLKTLTTTLLLRLRKMA